MLPATGCQKSCNSLCAQLSPTIKLCNPGGLPGIMVRALVYRSIQAYSSELTVGFPEPGCMYTEHNGGLTSHGANAPYSSKSLSFDSMQASI